MKWSNQPWREAGVRASSNSILPLQHSCAGDYERRAKLGSVHSHKYRWQTVQPFPASCLHKNTGDVYQRTALCWWLSKCGQQRSWYAVDCGSFLLNSCYVWSKHQHIQDPSNVHWTARDDYRSGSGKEDPSATKAYGALQKRLWSCHDISTKTKVKVYSVAVIPCLLYSIECTTFYRRHIVSLTRLQLCHLHSILNIKWQDHIPDIEVLRRAHTVSVEALITVSQLRWAGHVCRKAKSRLPKAVFYSELSQGKRSHGGQKLRFKDVLKRHMKKTGIWHDTLEEEALQRVKWRELLRKASSAVEEQRHDQQEYQCAHVRRHSVATSGSFQCSNCQRYWRTRASLTAHARACLR